MLTRSLKVGASILLALAMMLPEMTLPAAAFPTPQIQVTPNAETGFEEGVILVARRGHGLYYPRRGGGGYRNHYGYRRGYGGYRRGYGGYRRGYGYGHRYAYRRGYYGNGYYGGSGLYLGFGLPFGYYGGYGSYYDDYGYGYGGYSGGYSSAHVRWCLNRYRSYDPRTDTYLGYDGYRHRCRGPY